MLLRAATTRDAPAIAAAELAVWRTSMQDVADPQTVEELEPEELTAAWTAALGGDDDRVTLVAEHAPRVIGVAAWRLGLDGADATTAALTHLFVHPVAQGAGVGHALLGAAEDALRDRGVRGGWIDLHPGNWWAAQFLQARGWTAAEDPATAQGDRRWKRAL